MIAMYCIWRRGPDFSLFLCQDWKAFLPISFQLNQKEFCQKWNDIVEGLPTVAFLIRRKKWKLPNMLYSAKYSSTSDKIENVILQKILKIIISNPDLGPRKCKLLSGSDNKIIRSVLQYMQGCFTKIKMKNPVIERNCCSPY